MYVLYFFVLSDYLLVENTHNIVYEGMKKS